jgi:excisionase family DNA binding protein
MKSLGAGNSDESRMNTAQHYFEPLLDLSQAASLIGLHPDTLKRMARANEVPAFKMGKYWRFRASELDSWLKTKVRLAPTQITPR